MGTSLIALVCLEFDCSCPYGWLKVVKFDGGAERNNLIIQHLTRRCSILCDKWLKDYAGDKMLIFFFLIFLFYFGWTSLSKNNLFPCYYYHIELADAVVIEWWDLEENLKWPSGDRKLLKKIIDDFLGNYLLLTWGRGDEIN